MCVHDKALYKSTFTFTLTLAVHEEHVSSSFTASPAQMTSISRYRSQWHIWSPQMGDRLGMAVGLMGSQDSGHSVVLGNYTLFILPQ